MKTVAALFLFGLANSLTINISLWCQTPLREKLYCSWNHTDQVLNGTFSVQLSSFQENTGKYYVTLAAHSSIPEFIANPRPITTLLAPYNPADPKELIELKSSSDATYRKSTDPCVIVALVYEEIVHEPKAEPPPQLPPPECVESPSPKDPLLGTTELIVLTLISIGLAIAVLSHL